MLIEPRAPAQSTARDFIPNAFSAKEESNAPDGSIHWLATGRESLATSPYAAALQQSMLALARSLFLSRTIGQRSFVESREQEKLAAKLQAAFEAEPLEDGMSHPAETVIRRALQSGEGGDVLEWLRRFSLDTARPGFAASVLRCLGRQERPGTGSWRVALVRDGLAAEDVGIRDAAIQAAELWGDRDMRRVLEEHFEPVLWLRNYVRDVMEDLTE